MWIALIVIGVAMIVTALVLTPAGATATTDPCPPRWRPESCWARTPTCRRLRRIVGAPLRRPRIGARRADPVTADLAVVFPGQGTQFPGMGRPWAATPAWAAVVGPAEEALEEDLGHLLLDAGEDELGRTRNAQLAVLLTSLLVWESLRDRVRPVAFAGHSLGQVTALIAAGALPFDAGVRFAATRAELTQAAADATPGAMAALIGATLEQAQQACAATSGTCWIANDNAPGQVVIAGTPDGLAAGVAAAREAGVRTARTLAVGGAFHTPLMQPAADALVAVLADSALAAPGVPVVSNDDGHAETDPDRWRGARGAPRCDPGPVAGVAARAGTPRGADPGRGGSRRHADGPGQADRPRPHAVAGRHARRRRLAHVSGRVALVTGGSGGIGAATVRALVHDGRRVAIGYRTGEAPARRLAADLCADFGAEVAMVVTVSVEDPGFRALRVRRRRGGPRPGRGPREQRRHRRGRPARPHE